MHSHAFESKPGSSEPTEEASLEVKVRNNKGPNRAIVKGEIKFPKHGD